MHVSRSEEDSQLTSGGASIPDPEFNTQPRRRRKASADTAAVGVSLALLLCAAPLAIGSVHGASSALLEISVWLISLGWLFRKARSEGSTSLPSAVIAASLALCLYLLIQLLPLPSSLLYWIDPGAEDLRRQTIDTISTQQTVGATVDPSIARTRTADARRIEERAAEAGANATPPSLAVSRSGAASDLRLYLAYGLILWIAATLPRPQLLLRSAVAAGIAVGTVAIAQSVTWNGKILWFFVPYDGASHYPRMTGPFVNADHFALFLELALLPAAGLLFHSLRRRRGAREGVPGALTSVILGIGLSLMAAALIGSASRGGIIGALLGTVVFWWGIREREPAERANPGSLRNHVRRRSPGANRLDRLRRIVRRLAPTVVAVAVVVIGMLYAGEKARHLLDVRFARLILSSDLSIRVNHWVQTLPILRDFPLFGVGLSGWREVFPRYERFPLLVNPPNHAHNDYLEWWTEVGAVGVLLTVWLSIVYVRWARTRTLPREIRYGILATLAAVGWHEFLDFGLRVPANALLLSVLLGLFCNPYWSRADWPLVDEKVGGRPGLRRRWRWIAVAVTGVLCLASFRQLRESLLWQHVHDGSLEVGSAPIGAEGWYELGKRLAGIGKDGAPLARASFRAAIAARPSFGDAYWGLAQTEEDGPAKLAALEAAIYLQPSTVAWRLSRAALLERAGDSRAALSEFEEAVYRSPMLSQHPYLRKDDFVLTAPMVEAAERGLRRASDRQPDDPDLVGEVAAFYDRLRLSGEASTLWVRAANLTEDWALYGRMAAESAAHSRDYAQAEVLAREAIRRGPSEGEGYRTLAMEVYRPQKRYDEARQALELGARRAKRPGDLYVALYQLERDQGRMREAAQALAKAAALRQTDAALQFYLGVAYVEAGDNHRAVVALDRAIAIDPRPAQVYFYKGIALERRFDLQGAAQNYEKAVAREPSNPLYSESTRRVAEQLASGRKAAATEAATKDAATKKDDEKQVETHDGSAGEEP